MTSEPVVGVAKSRFCLLKRLFATFVYLFLHLHRSQLTRTSSYYRFRCHYPLITYLSTYYCFYISFPFFPWLFSWFNTRNRFHLSKCGCCILFPCFFPSHFSCSFRIELDSLYLIVVLQFILFSGFYFDHTFPAV